MFYILVVDGFYSWMLFYGAVYFWFQSDNNAYIECKIRREDNRDPDTLSSAQLSPKPSTISRPTLIEVKYRRWWVDECWMSPHQSTFSCYPASPTAYIGQSFIPPQIAHRLLHHYFSSPLTNKCRPKFRLSPRLRDLIRWSFSKRPTVLGQLAQGWFHMLIKQVHIS